MQYRSKIGSAIPISTIANRATSGSRLHHQQQQNKSIRERWQTKSKMKLRPSTFVMSMVMAETRCTTAHSPLRSFFLSDCGDNNSNIVSFEHVFAPPRLPLFTVVNCDRKKKQGFGHTPLLAWRITEQRDPSTQDFECSMEDVTSTLATFRTTINLA